MSAYPLMLEGTTLSAVIIGGGSVAARKATSLAAAGARVHIVAPRMSPDVEALAAANVAVRLTRERYSSSHIADALLVIAATDDPAANSVIAADARALGRLVNVASAPDDGNCITPAVHRAGDITVAVSAGGVPNAAARIRDVIARTIDDRYASAIRELSTLRRILLDDGKREEWSTAAAVLLSDNFCASVESGRFVERVAEWR